MKVIGIVGMPGSGKGEFSSISAQMGIPVVVMGDVIREEVKKEGLPPVDASMGIVARRLRETYGMAAIAHVCIPVIESQHAPVVLIDGIRGDAEVREFSGHFLDFILIAIESPLETRFTRLTIRGRSDDLQNISELTARDERESSFGLRAAMDLASIRVMNMGTLEEYRMSVRSTLEKIAGAS
ncbi:MAG: flagellar hook-basal body complex protein FliE [Methanospirillum sp.]|uniref:AAA family ATPase n=1 Tax=Methanospirillum sp. TaxID=45200 RepID=UPI002373C9CD|nr:AAA family ATPase [Methanospirillum sp.]MDD1727529.1 flagellar hook-basal body complex protein FliE [Methanospirillum sp.]